jgi:hypothetical protein
MAQVKILPTVSYNEVIVNNNLKLKQKLIPFGYKLFVKSKVYDESFNKPITLTSYKIEQLINY